MAEKIQITENFINKKKFPNKKTYLYGVVLSSGGLYYGLTVGMFNNFSEPFITEILDISEIKTQKKMESNLAFIYFIGCLIAAITGSFIYEKLGRLGAFYLSVFLEILASCFLCVNNIFLIYFGRFITGYFGCFWMFLSHLMINEMIDKKFRPVIANSFYIFITIGMILSFSIGTEEILDWYQFYFFLPIFFEIPRVLLISCYFYMESPVFLYNKYRQQNNLNKIIKKNYKSFYPKEIARTKTSEFLDQRKNMKTQSKKKVKLSDLFKKNYKKQLKFGIFINMMTQLTGINILTVFSNQIFKNLKTENPEFLTTIMAFFYLFSAIF